MKWFQRRKGIERNSKKRDIPNGVWIKCDICGEILYKKEIMKKFMVCTKCGYHFKVNSSFASGRMGTLNARMTFWSGS